MLKFIQKNSRFISPMPWLVLAAMKLWNAAETSQVMPYVASLAFALLAALFYFIELKLHQKRQVQSQ